MSDTNLHIASSPAAAASPVAIPPVFARPPAIASSAVWYAVSTAVRR